MIILVVFVYYELFFVYSSLVIARLQSFTAHDAKHATMACVPPALLLLLLCAYYY
jgi:hypothetical protein